MERGALTLALVQLAVAASLVSGADHESGTALVLQEFDIPTDGDTLLAPVSVNGRSRLFCIDTGCTGVIYDESLRPLLGNAVRSASVDSVNTAFQAQLFNPPDAFLGRLKLNPDGSAEKWPVACIDLSDCRGALGYDIRGVVGREFLKRYVVRFDFDRGKLQFRTAPGDDAGVRLPILFVKNIPLIRVELPGGVPTYFQIDTGFVGDSGSLHEEHVRYLQNKGHLTPLGDIEMAGPKGKRTTRTLRLASLRIGNFEHTGLIFHEHSHNTPSILGLGYCIRYIMTLDLGNSAIYLKPSKGFARREKAAHLNGCFRFGLAVAKRDGKAVVSFIMPGGPADNAGLLLSDVVLAVNGTDVSALRRFSILSLLTEAGRSVRLTVDRGGAHRDILVSLPPPLVVAAPPSTDSSAREKSAEGVVETRDANGATSLRSRATRPVVPADGARYRLGGQPPQKAKKR